MTTNDGNDDNASSLQEDAAVQKKHLETAWLILLHHAVQHEWIVCTHLLVFQFLFSLSYAVKKLQNV